MQDKPLSIVVLLSGTGSNFRAILDALKAQSFNADIKAVVSNKDDAPGLALARKEEIPDIFVDPTSYPDRLSFDQAMMNEIDKYKPELIILAGFMRILSDDFVNHYTGRLINIHPSLLPHFKGLNTHQRALDAEHNKHGATVHFVSNELDGGPVIAQVEVPVKSDDDAETLRLRVLKQEHILYPQVTKWFAERRLKLENDSVYFDQQKLPSPLLINSQSVTD